MVCSWDQDVFFAAMSQAIYYTQIHTRCLRQLQVDFPALSKTSRFKLVLSSDESTQLKLYGSRAHEINYKSVPLLLLKRKHNLKIVIRVPIPASSAAITTRRGYLSFSEGQVFRHAGHTCHGPLVYFDFFVEFSPVSCGTSSVRCGLGMGLRAALIDS